MNLLPFNVKHHDHRIKKVHGSAHKDHSVSIRCDRQYHLHSRTNGFCGLDINLVHRPGHALIIHEIAKPSQAIVPSLCHGVEGIITDQHRDSKAFISHAGFHDRQLNTIFRRQQCADDAQDESSIPVDIKHGQIPDIRWPGGETPQHPIDWSPLAGRDVIIHPDHDMSKESQP